MTISFARGMPWNRRESRGLITGLVGAVIILAAALLWVRAVPAVAQGSEASEGAMAQRLLTPEEMERRVEKLTRLRVEPLDLPVLGASRGAGDESYGDIRGDAIHGYLRKLVAFSQESKRNGDFLWGRLHGSVYERRATEYVRDQFASWGLEDVEIQPFTAEEPRWVPRKVDLRVLAGAEGSPPAQGYRFRSAMTAFPSGVTPAQGITAPVEFVGMGSPAELRGRDLSGKIALVYVHVWEDVLFHTGLMAMARLTEGTGAVGAILWLDRPGNAQVAAQVWNPENDEWFTDIPWANIGSYDGVYLRKLIERTDPANPPKVTLTVTADMVKDLKSQNLVAVVPGTTDENIIITAHIDGFFNAAQDTGAGVAGLMELARHYNGLPRESRRRNLIFLVTGDHEQPGWGGAAQFARRNSDLLAKTVAALQLEKALAPATRRDLNVRALANTQAPTSLFVSNANAILVDAFTDAAQKYGIPMLRGFRKQYAGDVEGLYGSGIPAAGWVGVNYPYHSEEDSPALIAESALQDVARAYASVIDRINEHTREELYTGASEVPGAIYGAEDLQFLLGMW
jgi:hypothetical protein